MADQPAGNFTSSISRESVAGAQKVSVTEAKPEHPGAAARDLQRQVDSENRSHGHHKRHA